MKPRRRGHFGSIIKPFMSLVERLSSFGFKCIISSTKVKFGVYRMSLVERYSAEAVRNFNPSKLNYTKLPLAGNLVGMI